VEGGSSFDFSSGGGLVSTGRLSVTKVIQLNAIMHKLSVSWGPILGIIVAKCSRSLKKRHQLDRTKMSKVETHRFWALRFGLSAAWDFHRWFGIGRPGPFSERRLVKPPSSQRLVIIIELVRVDSYLVPI
jgi:hypothetical protein